MTNCDPSLSAFALTFSKDVVRKYPICTFADGRPGI
jgi:hypothetical protein